MLELMLFYGIPYKDTNPIAHNLLIKFGSIINVLRAKTEDLCEISGVGAHASEFLHCIDLASDMEVYDSLFAHKEAKRYKSLDKLGEMLLHTLKNRDDDGLFAVMFNNRHEILKIEQLKDVRLYRIERHELVNDAIDTGAASIVLAQYKKNGIAIPYSEDIFAFGELKTDFSYLGITLAEFFIVTERDYSTVLKKTPVKDGRENINNGVYTFNANDGFAESESTVEAEKTESFNNIDSLSRAHEMAQYVDRVSLLEKLLSFTTRKPTRELAASLISKFGNIRNVMHAEEKALRDEGVSDIALTLLRITAILKKYLAEKYLAPELNIQDKRRILTALSLLFLNESQENFLLLMFNKSGKLCSLHRLAEGSTSTVSVTARAAIERAVLDGARSVILAHNHPDGTANPSKSDIIATENLQNAMRNAKIELAAHYIISHGKYCEIKDF